MQNKTLKKIKCQKQSAQKYEQKRQCTSPDQYTGRIT